MSATPNINPLKIQGNKLDATAAPTAGDDINDGYNVGSVWINVSLNKGYICTQSTAGIAIWKEIGAGGSDTNFANTNLTLDSERTHILGSNKLILNSSGATRLEFFGLSTTPRILGYDTSNVLKYALGQNAATTQGGYIFAQDGIDVGANDLKIRYAGSNNSYMNWLDSGNLYTQIGKKVSHVFLAQSGDLVNNKFIVGSSAVVGGEHISLQSDTLVKGSDTSSSTSGFKVTNSANASLLDIRNSGKSIYGKYTTELAGNSIFHHFIGSVRSTVNTLDYSDFTFEDGNGASMSLLCNDGNQNVINFYNGANRSFINVLGSDDSMNFYNHGSYFLSTYKNSHTVYGKAYSAGLSTIKEGDNAHIFKEGDLQMFTTDENTNGAVNLSPNLNFRTAYKTTGGVQGSNNIRIGTSADNVGNYSLVIKDNADATKFEFKHNGDAIIEGDTTVNGNVTSTSSSSNAGLIVKGDGSSTDGYIQLNCWNNNHGIKLKAPPHSAAASYTLTFPNDTGTSGQVLKTDGNGLLSWGAGGSTDTNIANADLTFNANHYVDLTSYYTWKVKNGSNTFFEIPSSGRMRMTSPAGTTTDSILTIDNRLGSGAGLSVVQGTNQGFSVEGSNNVAMHTYNHNSIDKVNFGSNTNGNFMVNVINGGLEYGSGSGRMINFISQSTGSQYAAVGLGYKAGSLPMGVITGYDRGVEIFLDSSVVHTFNKDGTTIFKGTTVVGTEKISLQDDTLVKGSDTSINTSGFRVAGSTNVQSLVVANNGSVGIGDEVGEIIKLTIKGHGNTSSTINTQMVKLGGGTLFKVDDAGNVSLPQSSGVLTVAGRLNVSNLPTSAAGLSSGDVWNNSGVLNIIP